MKIKYLKCCIYLSGLLQLLSAVEVYAQNPLVRQWDHRYGGMNYDLLTSLCQSADGGFLLAGSSYSDIGGDKTQPLVGYIDYWVVKTDAMGIKQWDKSFGGTDMNYLTCANQTADGGFILGGYSTSGVGGDKTQPSQGSSDYWIIKTDPFGNKQWDKTFGGAGYENITSIQQTTDGGYILGGCSESGVSGDKSQPTKGSIDYWIVKTDPLGNKLWDQDFGGISYDYLMSLQQTSDGGYILGGFTDSGISGDKTQASQGGVDYWIIKTDALGNKLWDRDYGGFMSDDLYSIIQTSDGGYAMGGRSGSGIGGDKTQPLWGFLDFWIVKTDALGNVLWDKDIGGTTGQDEFGIIKQTADGGFILSGTSYSNIGGDKTENNMGSEQSWVVKTDAFGTRQWDKTLLTNGHDECGFAIQTFDGCYVMANCTFGGIAGNKSDDCRGSQDYWIIKFCDTMMVPVTAGAAGVTHLCPGTCTGFLNLSLNATSYQWSFPGANPSVSTDVNPASICYPNPGVYDIELIATNGNSTDTLILPNYIHVYPSPLPQAIAQSGDTLFANTGATSYQWFYNGNLLSGATEYFYVAQVSGDYNVVAADTNGCEVEAVIYSVVAGLEHPAGMNTFTVAEDPAADQIMITKNSSRDESIIIYNVFGQKIYTAEENQKIILVNTRNFSPGVYFVSIGDVIVKFMK